MQILWGEKNSSFCLCSRRLTNASGKVSAYKQWTRRRSPRGERWRRRVPAQKPVAVPVRVPILPPPPHNLRRRRLRRVKPIHSPAAALWSAHGQLWKQILETSQLLPPFSSQMNRETTRDIWALLFIPASSSAAWTSQKNEASSRSSSCHICINQ